jgi:hypothetical protein
MIALTTVVFALLVNVSESWHGSSKSFLGRHNVIKSHQISFRRLSLHMSSPDETKSEEKKEEDSPRANRPPIMPFDFARDDIPIPAKKVVKKDVQESAEMTKFRRETNNARANSNRRVEDDESKAVVESPGKWKKKNEWVEDPSRPTGYANQQLEDDEENWVPSSDKEGVDKFLSDYFFESEYDSPKRKDAKGVIRNVTLISGIFGTVFTLLFYAFPGKFISYRGTADFSKRYSSDFINKDPSELLNDKENEDQVRKVEQGGGEFFDDGEGLPAKEQFDQRIPYQKNAEDARAPGRTEYL